MDQWLFGILISLQTAAKRDRSSLWRTVEQIGYDRSHGKRGFAQIKNETRVQLRPLILEGAFHVAPGETLFSENSSPAANYGVALTISWNHLLVRRDKQSNIK